MNFLVDLSTGLTHQGYRRSVGNGMPGHPVVDGFSGDTQLPCDLGNISFMDIEQMEELMFFPLAGAAIPAVGDWRAVELQGMPGLFRSVG